MQPQPSYGATATPQKLADDPVEHNARRTAMRVQLKTRGDFVGGLIAELIPHRYDTNGRRDYPCRDAVWAIHRDLAAAYAKAHNKANCYAMDATGHDAFLAYDAALAVSDVKVAA